MDRVLDGPTNEVWIQPWLRHLNALGVTYREGVKVTGLRLDGPVAGVQVDGGEEVSADWVVCALPVEVAPTLITDEMKEVDPAWPPSSSSRARWMNGGMFYLTRDVPLVHGHVIYMDSPWGLASISQAQFGQGVDLGARGNGQVHGILSLMSLSGSGPECSSASRRCGAQAGNGREVSAQLKAHLDFGGPGRCRTATGWGGSLTATSAIPTQGGIDLEPLLVNTAGSWDHRPDAATKIENFLLASDYVRTYTDLATIEGPTRPLAGPLTPSSTPRVPGAQCRSGPCATRRCSPRCAPGPVAISGSTGHAPGGPPARRQRAVTPGFRPYGCPTFPARAVGTSSLIAKRFCLGTAPACPTRWANPTRPAAAHGPASTGIRNHT